MGVRLEEDSREKTSCCLNDAGDNKLKNVQNQVISSSIKSTKIMQVSWKLDEIWGMMMMIC